MAGFWTKTELFVIFVIFLTITNKGIKVFMIKFFDFEFFFISNAHNFS